MQEEEKEYGRGNRARKEVNYKHDLISDEQWIRAMENEVLTEIFYHLSKITLSFRRQG